MTTKVRVGGVWRDIVPYVRVGGVWKSLSRIYVRVGGEWKETWVNALVTVSGETVADNSGSVLLSISADARVRFRSNGTVENWIGEGSGYGQIDAASDWVIPNNAAPGAYEVRATLQSGTLTEGTVGTWLALTSDRMWRVARDFSAGIGTNSAQILIEIRKDGVVLESGVYVLTATVNT